MKLIILKSKLAKEFGMYVQISEETLFKDIPTLGIAFTCIDNWCSDNGRNNVTIKDIFCDNNDEILIETTRNSIAKDEYNVHFKILND